jgi:hypothetical protein
VSASKKMKVIVLTSIFVISFIYSWRIISKQNITSKQPDDISESVEQDIETSTTAMPDDSQHNSAPRQRTRSEVSDFVRTGYQNHQIIDGYYYRPSNINAEKTEWFIIAGKTIEIVNHLDVEIEFKKGSDILGRITMYGDGLKYEDEERWSQLTKTATHIRFIAMQDMPIQISLAVKK